MNSLEGEKSRNQDIGGNRKLFWKEVVKWGKGEELQYSKRCIWEPGSERGGSAKDLECLFGGSV